MLRFHYPLTGACTTKLGLGALLLMWWQLRGQQLRLTKPEL
jgi:hypothetical protein